MIALTGPTGFLGQALLAHCRAHYPDQPLRPLLRSANAALPDGVVVGDLDGKDIDPAALAGCQVLIHCAARAHRMGESGEAALAAYRQVNVLGSAALMRAAIAAGLQRVVYVSSIKACAEGHGPGDALRPDQPSAPEDPYGMSKHEAEQTVIDLAAGAGIELAIIRPTLIHGPGAKGNLQRLLTAIGTGKRLPVGAVGHNRRSLLGLSNSVSAIVHVATAAWPGTGSLAGTRAAAADGCWRIDHLADDGVVSTRRLVELLAEGMGVAPKFLNLPRWAAMAAALPLGKAAAVRRLFGSLEVDDSAFRSDWGWQPEVGLEDGLRQIAAAWRERGGWLGE